MTSLENPLGSILPPHLQQLQGRSCMRFVRRRLGRRFPAACNLCADERGFPQPAEAAIRVGLRCSPRSAARLSRGGGQRSVALVNMQFRG